MEVHLVDHMGSDLSVVNAARVSFNKQSKELSDKDISLIKYLAKHNHWSPFAHTSISFRIKAPLFVARQLGKHQVGLVWNEVSRRYVDSKPEFYMPEAWRKKAENKKQGSSDETIYSDMVDPSYKHAIRTCFDFYTHQISLGMCPEQARMVLPQSMYTEWIWTGSLLAFHRVCSLRTKPDAQAETREIAFQIQDYLHDLFPVSYEALHDANQC